MIPLRNGWEPSSSAQAVLTDLLRKVDRLPRSAVQRRRVWWALTRPAIAGSSRPVGLRLVLAAALGATAASAGLAQYWPAAALDAPRAMPLAQASSSPLATVAPGPVIAERAEPEPSPSTIEEPKPKKARSSQPSRTDLEATLMLEALRTRNSGDAERVGKLAAEYQRKHPKGPLQEEALALALEAAAARRDPSAARLARDYLRRYPGGRFQAQAARVLRDAR
jgi:hypothetical protein